MSELYKFWLAAVEVAAATDRSGPAGGQRILVSTEDMPEIMILEDRAGLSSD